MSIKFKDILDEEIKLSDKEMINQIWNKTHKDFKGTTMMGHKGKWIMPPFKVYNMTTSVNLLELDSKELKNIYTAIFKK
jgi:hypothetical protein